MTLKFWAAMLGLFAVSLFTTDTLAQSSTGKATTSAPTYTNNTNAPLSLDLNGNLRVVNGGSPSGTQDVNIIAVGGNAVTTTVPISGTVSISGTSPVSGTVTADQGAAGTQHWVTDLTSIAGNNATQSVPGALDVSCISGCVAGAGVSQGAVTTAPPTYTTGTNNPLSLDLAGNLRTSMLTPLVAGSNTIGNVNQAGTWTVGLSAGSNVIGHVILDSGSTTAVTQATAANLNATVVGTGTFAVQAAQSGTWNVGVNSMTSGGATPYHLIAANSNNSTLISSGAHTVYSGVLANTGTTAAWLKFYDKGTAPTCGTDTPIASAIIPGAPSGGSGSNFAFPTGLAVTSGLGICVVTGIADNDNTSVAAATFSINIQYK